MSLENHERRLVEFEDIEAIKKLKARYCAHADNGFNADGIASLFTEDGIWDGKKLGRYEGRESIRAFVKRVPNLMTFGIHYVMNPIIELQGDKATGQWYLLQACTLAESGEAAWQAGRYDEEYVKVAGEWKFKVVNFTSFFLTPFDQGWVKKQFVF